MEIKFGAIQIQPKQKAVQAQKPTSTCIILHQNQVSFKGNKVAECMWVHRTFFLHKTTINPESAFVQHFKGLNLFKTLKKLYLQIVKEGSNNLFLSKIYCDNSDSGFPTWGWTSGCAFVHLNGGYWQFTASGLKTCQTVSWINQIILQISTWVMADSKTRQYCIFQQYLPIAQTLTLHHLALVNFRNLLLKKCIFSLRQVLNC